MYFSHIILYLIIFPYFFSFLICFVLFLMFGFGILLGCFICFSCFVCLFFLNLILRFVLFLLLSFVCFVLFYFSLLFFLFSLHVDVSVSGAFLCVFAMFCMFFFGVCVCLHFVLIFFYCCFGHSLCLYYVLFSCIVYLMCNELEFLSYKNSKNSSLKQGFLLFWLLKKKCD